jgi:D-tyrosyl-tRNA(Tyr) deacylase
LLGVGVGDTAADAETLAAKIAKLRIFPDAEGRFDRSLLDTGGAALIVSQFTLLADTRKGNQPSFAEAALCEEGVVEVATGVFGAAMQVELVNDGPVTLALDTPKD